LEFLLVPKAIIRTLFLKAIHNERHSEGVPFLYYVTDYRDIVLALRVDLCDKRIPSSYFGTNIGCCD